ncbi:MAG: DUF839 domain-containing protein [Saprospirales bacterium]|nr:DUF839 domain-containing protein [Saprospirales bacterium]
MLRWLFLCLFLNTLVSCENGTPTSEFALFEKYGPLVPDPAGIFDLPAGFTYTIISRTGEIMSDGLLTPDRPDGMATFPGAEGRVILLRNHELMPTHAGPFGADGALAANVPENKIYDQGSGTQVCPGGTTTLIVNETTLEVERSFLSLAGTLNNCSGGPTPWGSWITSEEMVLNGGQSGYQKDHGYNFEVPVSGEIGLADPVPLKAMGRFRHEAVGVDPKTSIVYQTEDMEDGLIYRYIPNVPGQLSQGGRLQALAIKGMKSLDTRNWEGQAFPLNKPMEVEWISLDNVDGPDDLRFRGFQQGAAVFARGEGMWFQNQECYFACTSGGQKKLGQIFRYIPSPFEGTSREQKQPGTLELFLQPENSTLARWADNLTVAPWGDLVVCEDNPNPFLFGVTPDGRIYKLGRNVGYESELAGCVFSPSGQTLFVNIQVAGLTLAVQGPW